MIKYIQLLLICTSICFSCTETNKKNDANESKTEILNETTLLDYIKTLSYLENEQRGIINRLNLNEELNKPQTEALERIIIKNGFRNTSQFILLNHKISIIYSSLQLEKDSEKIMAEKMSKHKISKTEYELVRKYLQELAEALQDIKMPELTKSN
jgi:hypothetical protein